jgi:hypothetical protein
MMFLFGGIPNICHDRFRERAIRELKGDFFTSLPLLPSSDRTYAINHSYCAELIRTLVAYVEGRPNCLDSGLGVVLVLREWETGTPFEANFWPFALCKTTPVDAITSRKAAGPHGANVYAATAISAAHKLRKPVSALTTEFTTRLRRTPLLLPVRHFGSSRLQDLMVEIRENVRTSASPAEAISTACSRFEAVHPYTKHGRGGSFESAKGVRFAAPGRNEFHGSRPLKKPEDHKESCFLNARTRLGGFFADGFHYDCTHGQGPYKGRFRDCHDQEGWHTGKPHLNVFPNDFIR